MPIPTLNHHETPESLNDSAVHDKQARSIVNDESCTQR